MNLDFLRTVNTGLNGIEARSDSSVQRCHDEFSSFEARMRSNAAQELVPDHDREQYDRFLDGPKIDVNDPDINVVRRIVRLFDNWMIDDEFGFFSGSDSDNDIAHVQSDAFNKLLDVMEQRIPHSIEKFLARARELQHALPQNMLCAQVLNEACNKRQCLLEEDSVGVRFESLETLIRMLSDLHSFAGKEVVLRSTRELFDQVESKDLTPHAKTLSLVKYAQQQTKFCRRYDCMVILDKAGLGEVVSNFAEVRDWSRLEQENLDIMGVVILDPNPDKLPVVANSFAEVAPTYPIPIIDIYGQYFYPNPKS